MEFSLALMQLHRFGLLSFGRRDYSSESMARIASRRAIGAANESSAAPFGRL